MSRLWMTHVFLASALLQIVDETCEAHRLLVNMKDGKAEFSIEMKCDGARKQFQRLR